MSKFFEYNQNNSGGSFDFDNNIGHFVIIEACGTDDADHRAEMVGIYFNGIDDGRDCDCCGDRWSRAWDDGTDTPEVYGKSIQQFMDNDKNFMWAGKGQNEVIVHYMDGRVDRYEGSKGNS